MAKRILDYTEGNGSIQLLFPSSKNNHDINYLPYGIITLPIEVLNLDSIEHRILVKPTNISIKPDYYGHETNKNGIENNSRDIKIIWGGGMTDGYKVLVKPGSKSIRLYYQILHAPYQKSDSDINHYVYLVDFEAIDMNSNKIVDAHSIELQTPPSYSSDTVKMIENDMTIHSKIATIYGTFISKYVSRWFGINNEIQFVKYDGPLFRIKYMHSGGYVSDQISIEVGNKSKQIAKINGDLARAKVHADLFDFIDDTYYVLRIWCYWINSNFTRGNGFINKIIEDANSAKGGDTELGAIRDRTTEVPDIERFDLVINKHTCKVVYVGTDLHWREIWWPISGEVAKLKFAYYETLPLILKRLPEILRYSGSVKVPNYDPVKDLKKNLERGNIISNKSSISTKTESTNRSTILGPGDYFCHVPIVFNRSKDMPDYFSHAVNEI